VAGFLVKRLSKGMNLMDYYIQIKLLPDPEFQETLLMNALFAKLHRALTSEGHGNIGVSFPQVKKTLGDTIRIHGNRVSLECMMNLNWLKGLTDHTSVSESLPTPENCQHRFVQRLQSKSSFERLYRRSVKKGWITAREAEVKIKSHKEQYLKSPYVQIKSHSTGQQFRLFINHGKLMKSSQKGIFSAYGLSNNATVPWF
jgi:CRISPR-associated endonuclease Csy4